MEVEDKPKKQNKAGKLGCIIALIVLALIVIAFFSGILNFQEFNN